MCGISIAIHTKDEPVADLVIRRMNDIISYRGPDDAGFYFDRNFAFGHRRLSILDLSAAGHQPMRRNKSLITYNGEVYNYIELRDELKTLGHNFQTATDTEVILAAYNQWGSKAFGKFNGMWAFAIYDDTENSIIFCRDHFGIKPLYFAKTANYFVGGSEIKQFTTLPDFKPVLNKITALNFLVKGMLNYSEETFFEGVKELRPGHYLRYNLNNHEVNIEQWYDLKNSIRLVKDSFEEAKEKIGKLFSESIKIRMRSDVRVGSCLSGGIDSSSIVCSVHKNNLANKDFATITSCYTEKKYDEQEFSDEVSAKTGFTSFKVFPELNDLWNANHLDKMIYHQDQPFSTASHYSEFKVFEEAAKRKMIVMLDGQGADEYVCGYGEFYIARMKELLSSLQLTKAFRLLKERTSNNNSSLAVELKNFMRTAYFFPFQDTVKKLLSREMPQWLSEKSKNTAKKCLVDFRENNVHNLSITEIVHSSIPYQLHSEDRNSMLFSIESRLPFLDHRLVEYVIGLPSSYKINKGYSKYVLREAVNELPEKIKYRKDKMGFVAPDPLWIFQNKNIVRKELEEAVIHTGIFSMELLTRFDRFINGELGYEPIYFRAMTLNRFCKIFQMDLN